jgi:hypothetical protein
MEIYIYITITLWILWSLSFMVWALLLTPWSCLSLEGNNSAGHQEISITEWNQKFHAYWINVHQLVTDSPSPCFNVGTTSLRNSGILRGGGLKPLPPKFRSFDKAEPNSQFCGKYTHNNLYKNMGFTHFQIEWNLWLGGYSPQTPPPP